MGQEQESHYRFFLSAPTLRNEAEQTLALSQAYPLPIRSWQSL